MANKEGWNSCQDWNPTGGFTPVPEANRIVEVCRNSGLPIPFDFRMFMFNVTAPQCSREQRYINYMTQVAKMANDHPELNQRLWQYTYNGYMPLGMSPLGDLDICTSLLIPALEKYGISYVMERRQSVISPGWEPLANEAPYKDVWANKIDIADKLGESNPANVRLVKTLEVLLCC